MYRICRIFTWLCNAFPSQYNSCTRTETASLSGTADTHFLVLVWFPPPQLTEHADHELHGLNTGHGNSLHPRSSLKGCKQGLSRLLRAKPHSRLRSWDPPPQLCEHCVHSDHGPNSGQDFSLQVLVSSGSPKHWSLGTIVLSGRAHFRVLFDFPPPQVSEHWLQVDHGVQEGQSLALHSRDSLEGPSQINWSFLKGKRRLSYPLKIVQIFFVFYLRNMLMGGKTHARSLICCPVPQLLEHSVHSDHSV